MQAPTPSGPEPTLVDALVARVEELDAQLRATAAAVDEKGLKEFRRTIEAISKRDAKFEERVTNKVDVVADRLETLARTMSTTSASLAAKDGEIAQLRRDLESGSSRVESAVAEARRGHDSGELAELKRELATLSKQKLPRGVEGRMDELTAKLTMLAQRIDTVSSTVSTTAAGLAGREGDVSALRRAHQADADRLSAELAEMRRGFDPGSIAELRDAVGELRSESSGHGRSIQRFVDEANATLKTLLGRLDSLSTSLASTSTQVSGGEEALATLRAEVEEVSGSLGARLVEQGETLAALNTQVASLGQTEADAMRTLDERVSAVGDKVERVAGQLETLGSAVSATREQLGERDGDIEAIERRFHEASARVDGLVGELARALAELPDPHVLEQTIQARLDELTERVEGLSGKVALAQTEAARQLEGVSASSRGLEERVAEGHRHVAELASALAALSEQTATIARDDEALDRIDERVSSMGGQIDGISGRLESLAASLSSATTRFSGSDEELAVLRAQLEDSASRQSSSVAELRQVLARLSAQTSALEQADGQREQIVEERVATFETKFVELARHVDVLAASVAESDARAATSDGGLSAMREHFEEGAARLGSHIGELRKAVSTLTTQTSALEQAHGETADMLDQRTGPLETKVDDLAVRFDSTVHGAGEQIERRMTELGERLDRVDEERAGASGEIARLAAVLEVERASVRTRLDALAALGETSSAAVVAGELERLSSALEADRASFQAQLEAIANALSLSSSQVAVDARLDDLAERLTEVERHGADVATKVSHASTLVPTALRSLEARLDEVAPAPRIVEATAGESEHVLSAEPVLDHVVDLDVESTGHNTTPVIQLRGMDS